MYFKLKLKWELLPWQLTEISFLFTFLFNFISVYLFK